MCGSDWYDRLFKDVRGRRGEASTAYTKGEYDREYAARIYEANARVKLIYLVRNPVDRAISHYLYNALNGREKRDIRSAIYGVDAPYVQVSLYYKQIARYLALFPIGQICVMQSEAFWRNTERHLQGLYRFLDVPYVGYTPGVSEDKYSLSSRVTRFVRNVRKGMKVGDAQSGLWEALGNGGWGPDLTSAELSKRLGFSPQDRQSLRERFREDVTQLALTFPSISDGWDI